MSAPSLHQYRHECESPGEDVTQSTQQVSIVIPCFNEEDVLSELFARLSDTLVNWTMPWEVICVDDGSHDATLGMLEQQSCHDHRWKTLSLSRNFGHQAAVSTGLQFASGDYVVVMDADLQDPPEILTAFIEKAREGYDVVFAIRQNRKENLLKRCCYAAFYRVLAWTSNIDIPLDSGDFCVMSRRVVQALNGMREKRRFVRGLRSWVGFSQTGICYERAGRAAGEPKYTFSKLLCLALDGIICFSDLPLRMAMFLGCLTVAFSLFGSVVVGTLELLSISPGAVGAFGVPLLILFLGGVQLTFTGVLGEYISRIYDEVKDRPVSVVQSSCGFNEDALKGSFLEKRSLAVSCEGQSQAA